MKIRERPESSHFQGKSCPIRGWSENFHFQEGLGSFRGNISEQDTSIIKQARRILFNNGEPWVKKKSGMKNLTSLWDVSTELRFVSW